MNLQAVPFRQEPFKKTIHLISRATGGGKLKLGAIARGRGSNSPLGGGLATIWLASLDLPIERTKMKSDKSKKRLLTISRRMESIKRSIKKVWIPKEDPKLSNIGIPSRTKLFTLGLPCGNRTIFNSMRYKYCDNDPSV